LELILGNLSVAIDNKLILDSINLKVKKGELLALLGPSGCGKSTLLKTIAGLLPPASGYVMLNGKDATDLPPNQRGVVIVFQDLRLFPNMTVEENIAFPLKVRGIPKGERLEKVHNFIAGVQLQGLEKRKVTELSGGQLQRVALARALAAEPKILLLDEPFSSLDENLRRDMRRLVMDLRRRYGITTVLVTHDRQEAFMMADRIAIMFSGKIVQCDTPKNIYHAPATKAVADFLGGGNYIQGTVKNGQFLSNIINFPVSKPDGQYTALFRVPALKALSPAENPQGEQTKQIFQITDLYYLGDQTEIIAEGSGQQLKLNISSDHSLSIGDKIHIDFDLSQVVLIEE